MIKHKFLFYRRNQNGFTLIELMITVAIVAILAAIAYPSYQQYIQKSRRVDAKNALLDLASREERYYSINNKYTQTATDLGYSSLPWPVASSGSSSYYNLSFTAGTTASWTATAAPTGAQATDKCGSFTITSQGSRGVTGGTANVANCW